MLGECSGPVSFKGWLGPGGRSYVARVFRALVACTASGLTPAREDSYAEVGSLQPLPPGGPHAALQDALAGVSYDIPPSQLPLVESGTFFLSRGRMIRTPEWKYAHYVDDIPELYHLRTDPWELDNLAGRPEHRERETALRTRLLERSIQAGDPR